MWLNATDFRNIKRKDMIGINWCTSCMLLKYCLKRRRFVYCIIYTEHVTLSLNKTIVERKDLLGEDPRLFVSRGKFHISYNTHFGRFKKFYYAEVHFDAKLDMFYIIDPPHHVIFEDQVDKKHGSSF